MAKYEVRVEEETVHRVTVEADSVEEAEEVAVEMLGDNTFVGVEDRHFDVELIEETPQNEELVALELIACRASGLWDIEIFHVPESVSRQSGEDISKWLMRVCGHYDDAVFIGVRKWGVKVTRLDQPVVVNCPSCAADFTDTPPLKWEGGTIELGKLVQRGKMPSDTVIGQRGATCRHCFKTIYEEDAPDVAAKALGGV